MRILTRLYIFRINSAAYTTLRRDAAQAAPAAVLLRQAPPTSSSAHRESGLRIY